MKKRTRFVALLLVALLIVTASFTLCGCDTLRNIMDNLSQIGSNKESEEAEPAEQAGKSKVVKTNVRKDSGSNKLVPASDVIMPDKNNTNLAKTPLFPRFSANSRLKYVQYVCASLYQKSSEISTFWSERV